MPITHPALPQPGVWRVTLACGHQYVMPKVDDVSRPLLCTSAEHDEPGALVMIVRVERAG